MGPDLDHKGRLETAMEASSNKEAADVKKEQEHKHVKCVSNYEDNTFDVEAVMDEQNEGAERSMDTEVDIIGNANCDYTGFVEAECLDETESSSSFDDTVSGVENSTIFSDVEVESELHGDASSAFPFDGYNEIFRLRKKRLTPHWRTYIQPIMWRCKWLELQIKYFQSQAIKFDRELAEDNQRKQLELENCTLEGFCTKTFPFSGRSQKQAIIRRKKRKRVEDTMDISRYTTNHNLFSYYENKRSASDAALMDNNWGNQVVCAQNTINGNNEIGVYDKLLSHELRDGDNSVEQILWKIGVVQLQVSKMKTRLKKVMGEIPEEFFSTDNLSLLQPCNVTSSSQNPGSPHNSGDRTMLVGSSHAAAQLISEHKMDDLVKPEIAASCHEEVTPVPHKIESSKQPEVGGASRKIVDGILIYNRRAKDASKNLKKVSTLAIQKPLTPKEEQDGSNLGLGPTTDDQPTPKIGSIAKITATSIAKIPATKNKRKRGRRKAGSSRWSRRSSG